MADLLSALAARAGGDGHFPGFHALWPLFEMGVVTDLADFSSPAWDAAEAHQCRDGVAPTRVALIDTSVAVSHPNLQAGVAAGLALDLFSSRLGTFPYPRQGGEERLHGLIAANAAPVVGGVAGALFEEMLDHLSNEYNDAEGKWDRAQRILPATSQIFSAHGTAMAGLIAARPRGAEEDALAGTRIVPLPRGVPGLPAQHRAFGAGFPFVGVDPFCELVPISISSDPDPEQAILALLYAHLIEADVIVLPRDFPDPTRSPATGARDPETGGLAAAERTALEAALPTPLTARERELWQALEGVILAVSQHRPLVAACGNGGDQTMIYPARLAAPGNGILAVGAQTSTGFRAGYSTVAGSGEAVTLYAPSGDGERLDDGLQRLDTTHGGYRETDHSRAYRNRLGVSHHGSRGAADPVGVNTFSPLDVISTDVPGAAGYSGSPFARSLSAGGAILDLGSYYCRFSGTSAATALAAGMISLAISAGRLPRGDGLAPKAAIAKGRPGRHLPDAPAVGWHLFD